MPLLRQKHPRRLHAVSDRRPLSQEVAAAPPQLGSPLTNGLRWSRRVYAIAFDLDTEILAALYHNPAYPNAYEDVLRVFDEFGFARQQVSVYFAQRDDITLVACVLAVQEVSRRYPWFRNVVKDIRMLRIEETNDLMPALGDFQPLVLGETAVE